MVQKSEVKISILQMASEIGDVESNIKKAEYLIYRDLTPDFSDVLVLPEVWTVGWSCSNFVNSAQSLSGSVIDFLKKIAVKFNINIIGGSFVEKAGDKYFNSCPVISRSGELVGKYSKMHLYSYYGCDEGKYVSAGNSPLIVELDGVKYGISICYDIRFPELYRAYAKAGADLLVNCAAWGAKKPVPWEMMTKSRAIENQCYMVALTQCGYIENGEYNLGQSRIIDYKGDELAFISENEGIVSADISLDLMYDFRAKSPILNDIRNDYEVKNI